jgi:hypothetical protein
MAAYSCRAGEEVDLSRELDSEKGLKISEEED